MTTTLIKQQTENWLKNVIIHYNICPFAREVVEKKSVHYCIDEAQDIEQNLQTLIFEAIRLDSDETVETTLLIYSSNFAKFDDFLDYLDLANQLLELQGYQGVYQLASFHPDYCFDGVDESDAANYTNRSPYPMLHLIREASIEKALKFFPNPESIPQRNIDLLRDLGLAKAQALLATCKINT